MLTKVSIVIINCLIDSSMCCVNAVLIKSLLPGNQKFDEQLPAPRRMAVATKSNQKFD